MEVDEAMKKLGKVGKWQVSIYFGIIVTLQAPLGWNTMYFILLGYEPPHHCKLPANASVDEWIPRDSSGGLSSCSMFFNSSISNQTNFCVHGWQSEKSLCGPTMVTKWDLVCSQAYLPEVSQTIFSFGMVAGGLLVGRLADRYGKKWNCIGISFFLSIVELSTLLIDSLLWFMVIRFMVGLLTSAGVMANTGYIAESFSTENKIIFTVFGSVSWAIHPIVMVLMAYLVSWFNLALVFGIYALTVMPLAMWWLPETVFWLPANNKIEEAEMVLLRAAKMNSVILVRPILKPLENGPEEIEIEGTQRLDGATRKNEEKSKFFVLLK